MRTITILRKWKLRRVRDYYEVTGVDQDDNLVIFDSPRQPEDRGDYYIISILETYTIKLFKKDRICNGI